MSIKKVDLGVLPIWLQYIISLATTAIVVAVTWIIGRNQPAPEWITTYLISILGWAYLILSIVAIAVRIFQKPKS